MWQGDVVQTASRVNYVKPVTKPSGEFRRNPSLAVGFEEITQALMPERTDHRRAYYPKADAEE